MSERLTRRKFLKSAVFVGTGFILGGCGRGAPPPVLGNLPLITPITEDKLSEAAPTPTITPVPKENLPIQSSPPTATPTFETSSAEELKNDALHSKKRLPNTDPPRTPTVERKASLKEEFIWRGDSKKPLVALTFDDGWFPESIKLFIETLKQTGVKLTVFPSGQAINAFPDLFREIDKLGCEFGCHGTYDHKSMVGLSVEEIVKEIDKSQKALNNVLGRQAPFSFLRPVGGAITEEIVRAMAMRNLKGVIWTLSGEGTSKIATPDYVAERIISLAGNGFITLHHFIENDARALKTIVLGLKKKGLSPARLSEVL